MTKKAKKAVTRPPLYSFCRICGLQVAKGPEREAHDEAEHAMTEEQIKKVIRTPRLAWAKTKPKDDELMTVEALEIA